MFRTKVVFSPVEIDWLKANRDKMSENQLSLALAKSRAAIKRKLLELDGKPLPTKAKGKKSVIGKRPDLNQFVRSGWEANCLRYLRSKGIQYMYEPKVFTFEGIKHGTVSYCPDIYLPSTGEWIEIKGFLDSKSKTQLRRFKKFYPEEFKNLRAVVGSSSTKAALFFKELGVPLFAEYNQLNKLYRNVIENWE